MRKIIVTEYVTLDGVMQDPGGAEKAHFPAGGWSMAFWSDEAAKYKYDELFASDAMLLGRVTYEGFAKAWPAATDTGDFGERMNGIPKYVVSTTLETAEWNNSHIIKENVAEAITELKQQEGQDILVAGSAKLVQSLMQNDLIDEYRLMMYPIILGSGKRLFPDMPAAQVLKLVETKPLGTSGVVVLHYQPAPSA